MTVPFNFVDAVFTASIQEVFSRIFADSALWALLIFTGRRNRRELVTGVATP
jgi:hypothetical protein